MTTQDQPTVLTKNKETLLPYMAWVPAAHAFERWMECLIHSRHDFKRPVLDLGCGDGLFARVMFADPVDTGVDPDARELKHARRLNGYHELLCCSGARIPKPDGFYQTIYSNSVLEHIPDLRPVLQELFRLLAPGGTLYITVPSDRFDAYAAPNQILQALGLRKAAALFRRLSNRFWKLYNRHSREEWQHLLRDCGFRVTESFEYDPPLHHFVIGCMVPFSFIGYCSKRLTNRWTWIPAVRRFLFYPFHSWIERRLSRGVRVPQGGLVYLAATKDV